MGRLFAFFFFMIGLPALVIAQKPDSVFIQKDSLQAPVITITNHYENALQTILKQNTFLNSQGTPITMAVKIKKIKIYRYYILFAGSIGFFNGIDKSFLYPLFYQSF